MVLTLIFHISYQNLAGLDACVEPKRAKGIFIHPISPTCQRSGEIAHWTCPYLWLRNNKGPKSFTPFSDFVSEITKVVNVTRYWPLNSRLFYKSSQSYRLLLSSGELDRASYHSLPLTTKGSKFKALNSSSSIVQNIPENGKPPKDHFIKTLELMIELLWEHREKVDVDEDVSYEFDKFNNTCVMPLLSGNLALKWNDVIIFFNEKSMQEISSD